MTQKKYRSLKQHYIYNLHAVKISKRGVLLKRKISWSCRCHPFTKQLYTFKVYLEKIFTRSKKSWKTLSFWKIALRYFCQKNFLLSNIKQKVHHVASQVKNILTLNVSNRVLNCGCFDIWHILCTNGSVSRLSLLLNYMKNLLPLQKFPDLKTFPHQV